MWKWNGTMVTSDRRKERAKKARREEEKGRKNMVGGKSKRGGREGGEGKKRGGKEWKNLVQQVTGTLVCQSGGRRDVCHASLQPHLKGLKSNIV